MAVDLQHLSTLDDRLVLMAASTLRIVVIATGAWLLTRLAHRVIGALREHLQPRLHDREAIQRAETLGRALRYASSVMILLLATMLILSELGISLAPLLGAAGVAGLAIGFGAQALVKDYFAGLSLLLEDQIRQGDVVKLGEHAGVVEEVTLRHVRLRDYDGAVHFVPNGSIPSVINMGRGHAYAVLDIGLAYGTNLDQAMAVMQDVASSLQRDPAFRPRILEPFELAGVDQLADSAVLIKARFKVLPLEQWNVKRAYFKLLKQAFDQAGIAIPYPHLQLVNG